MKKKRKKKVKSYPSEQHITEQHITGSIPEVPDSLERRSFLKKAGLLSGSILFSRSFWSASGKVPDDLSKKEIIKHPWAEASGMDMLAKGGSAINRFIARTDFIVPQQWTPETINGRNFWNVFLLYYKDANRLPGYNSDFSGIAPDHFRNPSLTYIYPEFDRFNYIFAPDVLMTADKASEHLKRLSKIPAFTDTSLALVMYRGYLKNPDGSISLVLPHVPKGLGNRPLFLDVQNSVRLGTNPRNFLLENFRSDRKALDTWNRDNPNFKGFISGLEWVGDLSHCKDLLDAITGRLDDPNHWAFKAIKRNQWETTAISDAEYERLIETWCPPVKEAGPYRLGVARKEVGRLSEMCFGDPSLLVYGDGHINSYHLIGKWGTGLIWMETSRPWQMWQNQMMGARGAARQFNKPWMWYVAANGNGYDNTGKFQGGAYQTVYRSERNNPFQGLSFSSVKRAFYMSYFSGANYMQVENALTMFFTFPLDAANLSTRGHAYVDFYNFTQENPDRGVPYTPVALLSPWNKLSDRGGKSCGTPGGAMHHAFLCSIYRMFPDEYLTSKYPNYEHVVMGRENKDSEDPVQRKEGREWCFSNNPYGDVFDQLTPDFEDKDDFKRVIDGYKVAIMLDEFAKDAEMVDILVDYVRKGGTLVVNTRQLNELFPKEFTGVVLTGEMAVGRNGYAFDGVSLVGAKVIKGETGIPVFTRNVHGKGAVVVTTPCYMIPNQKDYSGLFNDAKSGKAIFPYIRELLDGICGESLPIKVTGDIQFGLNKTSSGWWIYLLNNKGVYRLYGDPEKFDQNRTSMVTVDVSRLRPKTVRELFSGENVPVEDGKATVTVGPGDLKCLQVDCQKGSS